LTENEFINEIDARFPHWDKVNAHRLIRLGASISPNAAYMVLYELCTPPIKPKVRPYISQKYIEFWSEHFDHPLNSIVVPIAHRIVRHKPVSRLKVMKALNLISAHNGLYNAMNIVLCAADDTDESIESLSKQIVSNWKSA